jgi:hypothetical protein
VLCCLCVCECVFGGAGGSRCWYVTTMMICHVRILPFVIEPSKAQSNSPT